MSRNHHCSEFFIVGTGRCGTNLLMNLLKFHPDIWIARETHWIPLLYHNYGLEKLSYEEFFNVLESVYMARGKTAFHRMLMINGIDPVAFKIKFKKHLPPSGYCSVQEMMNLYYTLITEHNHASIWGDKTPDYGFFMDTLQKIWPKAKFIHIVRDGRDVALSMSKVPSFRYLVAWKTNQWLSISYKKKFERKRTAVNGFFPLEAFMDLWKNRLLGIWDKKNRLNQKAYKEIRYEDLLKNPSRILKSVSSYLKLPGTTDWNKDACRIVRRDNLLKNIKDPDWNSLTRQYGEELRQMGFKI